MAYSTIAVQVGTSPTVLAGPSAQPRTVTVQNLGPNPIFVGGQNVTSATGVQISGTTPVDVLSREDGGLWAICSTLQVTPADTRVGISD